VRDTFLPPDSIAWRVHRHPTMLIGGLRALILQTLHPQAMAGVAIHSDYKKRALDRLRRTSLYVAATTFGDRDTALAAAARVKKVHEKVRGTDPVTGLPYSAGDPETQLWVHCAEVHSFQKAYTALGLPLTERERDQYFEECARLGSLLDMPYESIPKSVAEMREYFRRIRPKLVVSEVAREAISFIVTPPITRELVFVAPLVRLSAQASVALVPRHLRKLAGIDRSPATDAAVLAALRPSMKMAAIKRFRDMSPMVAFTEHVVGKEAVAYARMAWTF
jgi:uncharacterized protein (DUF2236 family)